MDKSGFATTFDSMVLENHEHWDDEQSETLFLHDDDCIVSTN
jgi:hypothetical protein